MATSEYRCDYAVVGNCIFISTYRNLVLQRADLIPFDKVTRISLDGNKILITTVNSGDPFFIEGVSKDRISTQMQMQDFFVGLSQQFLKFKDPSYEVPDKPK